MLPGLPDRIREISPAKHARLGARRAPVWSVNGCFRIRAGTAICQTLRPASRARLHIYMCVRLLRAGPDRSALDPTCAELERRERAYRGSRPPLATKGHTLLLVDDGAATGSSMLAAVRAARKLGADRVVVALPVASTEAHKKLREEADEVVCVSTPIYFYAVGQWYQESAQTTDDEVTELLARAKDLLSGVKQPADTQAEARSMPSR